jgi:hypothetical protein
MAVVIAAVVAEVSQVIALVIAAVVAEVSQVMAVVTAAVVAEVTGDRRCGTHCWPTLNGHCRVRAERNQHVNARVHSV